MCPRVTRLIWAFLHARGGLRVRFSFDLLKGRRRERKRGGEGGKKGGKGRREREGEDKRKAGEQVFLPEPVS